MELQKTKEDKSCQIYNFLFFKSPISLSDKSRITFRKLKNCTLNIRFLYQFIQSSKYVPLRLHYYKKVKALEILQLTFF